MLVVGVSGAVVLATPSLHHLYLDQNLRGALQAPGRRRGHLLGTDQYGRDMVWRIVAGTRHLAARRRVVTTTVTLVLGLAFGSVAGYFGGKIDTAIAR